MELTQLLYFKTAAGCENMSRAAEQLHISQPALSTAVKNLEAELGISLFDRGKNKIVLNENGRRALAFAEEILTKAAEMKKSFTASAEDMKLLSLGFCDPGPMRLSVPLFQKAFPGITVTSEIFDGENIAGLLLSRRYDAVISLQKTRHKAITTVPFAREELMLSVPAGHRLASEPTVCLHREKDLEMAVYCGSGAYIRQLEPLLRWLSERHTVEIFRDYFVFKQLLDQKNVATFTTRLVQRYRYDGENRVVIPLTDEGIAANYWLSFLKGSEKRLAPLQKWINQNTDLLFGAESRGK